MRAEITLPRPLPTHSLSKTHRSLSGSSDGQPSSPAHGRSAWPAEYPFPIHRVQCSTSCCHPRRGRCAGRPACLGVEEQVSTPGRGQKREREHRATLRNSATTDRHMMKTAVNDNRDTHRNGFAVIEGQREGLAVWLRRRWYNTELFLDWQRRGHRRHAIL